jgi:phage-related protein
MNILKAVIWMGSSRADLIGFPADARREAGYQLERVQHGDEPQDWKPMSSVGPGVREIRIREPSGAFRVMYLATRPEAIYVLHCFQKKSQQTSRQDLALAKARLKAVPAAT